MMRRREARSSNRVLLKHASQQARNLQDVDDRVYPIPWRGDLALALAATGEREAALALAAEDLERARRFGAAGVRGSAERTLGLVTGGEDGLVLLADAARTLAGSSARLLYAEALTDLGAALRRANHRAAARDPLRLAIDEHRAAGGRARRTFVSGVESLTPSERRVARMAASGLTNREIAQQLYLTVKTVEMHVGNALAKLDISSRRQFATVLAHETPVADA
jgi:DNA-binding CsgD family transcriptional regulator